MNIFKIFETIENAVFTSQRLPWPFSEWTIIHRHNFLRLVDKMRQSVPEEMKQARAVSHQSKQLLSESQLAAQEMLDRAREQARAMLEGARAEREAMLNGTEVVMQARQRAEEMDQQARQRAEQLEQQTRQRCQDLRQQAEAHATRVREEAEAAAATVVQKAEALTRGTESEIDAYAIGVLSQLERELARAADVLRVNREHVQARQQMTAPSPKRHGSSVTPGLAHAAPAAVPETSTRESAALRR